MKIDTSAIVTATEANQNFSKVARLAEKKGKVVVFKNNRPKLLVIDLDTEPQIEMTEDEKLTFVASRILREHRAAFEELAKEGAFAGFGDQEFYPTKEEKGARLGYTLISNHAFVDGNKRIGVYIMLSFLEMNGIRLQCTDEELVNIGLSIASGTMKYEELLQWVLDHKA